MPFDKETARKAGRASGRVRRERLTADRVVEELGLLKSVDDAMRRLDRLNVWIASGFLTGSAGSAASRCLEIWLRGHESKLTQQVVEELKGRLEELEGQIKRQRAMGVVR